MQQGRRGKRFKTDLDSVNELTREQCVPTYAFCVIRTYQINMNVHCRWLKQGVKVHTIFLNTSKEIRTFMCMTRISYSDWSSTCWLQFIAVSRSPSNWTWEVSGLCVRQHSPPPSSKPQMRGYLLERWCSFLQKTSRGLYNQCQIMPSLYQLAKLKTKNSKKLWRLYCTVHLIETSKALHK